jgi:hypothetical protein
LRITVQTTLLIFPSHTLSNTVLYTRHYYAEIGSGVSGVYRLYT